MDLRNLPDGLSSTERVDLRRTKIEGKLKIDLSATSTEPSASSAELKNCEQMFGAIPIPVGYAGPLNVTFSSGDSAKVHLPLATTEAALVASVNRGCKALGTVTVSSTYHGVSRSITLKSQIPNLKSQIELKASQWKKIGESTSAHLKIIKYDLDESGDYLFLTIYADTDEAMGMNMVTIAAAAIGNWIHQEFDCEFVTVAGNVDSDKKPSIRTKERGRGYEVIAEATLDPEVVTSILKTTPEALLEVADAKLNHGSKIAGAIGSNLHAANVIAALYLATGQDAAHVVEGSLADTEIDGLTIRTRLPALLLGVRGGGTGLLAQSACLNMLLKNTTSLHPCKQLAESIGAAVLAGELSLLAAQSAHHLAKAHKKLART